MYFNNNFGYSNNRNNMYNNQMQGNKKSPYGSNFKITEIFLGLLLVLTFLIMIVHIINFVSTNNKLEDDDSNKNDEIGNVVNNSSDEDVIMSDEEKNENELVKLCKIIDSNGSYKYDEYLSYIDSFDFTNMSDAEIYEIMSKKNYCYDGVCIKIEKSGMINYVECGSNTYHRISYDEYEKLKEMENEVDDDLKKACLSVDKNGYYDSGAATGIRVTCDNYICTTDYNDEIFTKTCK